MAEVAGTAVGIISLGIQICQGFVSYFQDLKGQDEKISYIVQDIQTLSNTLESLKNCFSVSSSRHPETLAQAEHTIVECLAAIKRLDELLAKCRQTAMSPNFKERIQLLSRRAVFPFRQSIIDGLRETVKGLQANVLLALQALQIELTQDLPERASELLQNTISTSDVVSQVRQDISRQDAKILDIQSSISELKINTRNAAHIIKQALPVLQQSPNQCATGISRARSMSMLTQQINTHDSNLRQDVFETHQDLEYLPALIEENMFATLEMYFNHQAPVCPISSGSANTTVLRSNEIPMELLRKPSLLRSFCDMTLDDSSSLPGSSRDTKNRRQDGSVLIASKLPRSTSCSCKISNLNMSRSWTMRSLNFFQLSTITHLHQKDCPLRSQMRTKTVLGMRYSYCGLLASQMLQFSLAITRGAGGLSVSPNLAFRATVSNESPAFALFNPRNILMHKTIRQLGDHFESIAQELHRLFLEGRASPSDVNEQGETLLLSASKILNCLDSYSSHRGRQMQVASKFRKLVLSLQDWGVDVNEASLAGTRPLDEIVFYGTFDRYDDELASLAVELFNGGLDFSDSGWQARRFVNQPYWSQSSRNTMWCLTRYGPMNEFLNGLQCGDLSRAILQKKESEASRILEESPTGLSEKNRLGQTPLHLACTWPAGIALLLNAGGKRLVNRPDNAGYPPLAYASYWKCLPAVQLLLDADSTIYMNRWVDESETNRSSWRDMLLDAVAYSTDEIVRYILQALVDRRQRLANIAMEELHYEDRKSLGLFTDKLLDANAAHVYKLLEKQGISLPRSLFVPSNWLTIFHAIPYFRYLYSSAHCPTSLAKWVDVFFDAGFQDLESVQYGRNLLMREFSMDMVENVDCYMWCLRKGVRPDQRLTFAPHTPAALYVGKRICSRVFDKRYDWNGDLKTLKIIDFDPNVRVKLRRLLKEVVLTEVSDDCNCACSLDGCCAITAMLKHIVDIACVSYKTRLPILHEFTAWLIDLIGTMNDEWNFMIANIVQFLTFTRLRLTHTCCKYEIWLEYFDDFDDNDCLEIQEEEHEDLGLLKSLMSEFEYAYVHQGLPLLEFLEGYWKRRMNEVTSRDVTAMNEKEIRSLRDLGVVLETHKTTDSAESDLDD